MKDDVQAPKHERRTMWGQWRAVLTAGLALVLASACLPGRAAEKLVIITPHWEGIRKEYEWAFAEWSERELGERIEIDWIDRGGTSSDLKFVESEFGANPEGIGIDMFWGGGTDPHLKMADAGLLSSYRAPDELLATLPEDYFGIEMYDPEHRWYGTALAGFGILYNKIVLRKLGLPTPQSWRDLADPRLTSWVGSADPRQSGSVHMMYEIMLQAYGWEEGLGLITRLGANVRSFPKGGSQTPKDVAIGEAACGLAIDIYGLSQIAQAQSEELAYLWPEGETVINPDCISMLKGAPHREAAERFIDFVLSPAGQKVIMLPPGEAEGPREFQLARMSVLPALYGELGERSAVTVNPFEWQSSLQYDPAKGGARWGLVNDLIGALIIDTHPDLVAAWRALQEAGMPAEALAELERGPVSEEEALRLATEEWKDQETRNREISRWRGFAREKYRRVRKRCGDDPDSAGARLAGVARGAIPAAAGLFFLWAIGDLVVRGVRRVRGY